MATEAALRAAFDRVAIAQRKLALADRNWDALGRSRAAFISSLRHTGLSYAHARTKFDDFVESQRALRHALVQDLEAAQQACATLQEQAALTTTAGPQQKSPLPLTPKSEYRAAAAAA